MATGTHADPRYGFYKTAAEEEQWVGDFDLYTMTYVRVVRFDRKTGLPPGITATANRKHWVYAKDELEAFMRLTARRNANI